MAEKHRVDLWVEHQGKGKKVKRMELRCACGWVRVCEEKTVGPGDMKAVRDHQAEAKAAEAST